MVPAPANTPMPEKANADKQGQLYSIYMRPWFLDCASATKHVPHILDLNVVPSCLAPEVFQRNLLRRKQPPLSLQPRSFKASWTWYIRGHVVSKHAARIIVQFMAANCGRSTSVDKQDDCKDEESKKEAWPSNALSLSRIHKLLDGMASDDANAKKRRKTMMTTKCILKMRHMQKQRNNRSKCSTR